MDIITKNLHFLIFLYACWGGFEYFNEKEEQVINTRGTVEAQERKILRVKKDLKAVKKYQTNLARSRENLKNTLKQIETAQKQLPSEIRDVEIKQYLKETSESLKIINSKTLGTVEENKDFYFSKDYNFDAQGTYLQFLILFENLEEEAKKGRILNVKYVRMKVSEDSDKRSRFQLLDMSATLETYRYNESYDATSKI